MINPPPTARHATDALNARLRELFDTADAPGLTAEQAEEFDRLIAIKRGDV